MNHQFIRTYVTGSLVNYFRDIHPERQYPDTNSTEFQTYLHDTMDKITRYLNGNSDLNKSYSDIQCTMATDLHLIEISKNTIHSGNFTVHTNSSNEIFVKTVDTNKTYRITDTLHGTQITSSNLRITPTNVNGLPGIILK